MISVFQSKKIFISFRKFYSKKYFEKNETEIQHIDVI